jgi:hypothetical protein
MGWGTSARARSSSVAASRIMSEYPAALAAGELAAHRAKLGEYRTLLASLPPDVPAGPRLSLEAGIGHEEEWVGFWERVGRS